MNPLYEDTRTSANYVVNVRPAYHHTQTAGNRFFGCLVVVIGYPCHPNVIRVWFLYIAAGLRYAHDTGQDPCRMPGCTNWQWLLFRVAQPMWLQIKHGRLYWY